MKLLSALLVLSAATLAAQTPGKDPWESLKFLEGNWEAKTAPAASNANVSGSYFFRKELGGHVLARHSSSDTCKGPADFDCDHHDLLYIYQDAAGQPLKAMYFDNEGHVIHYDVSTPASETALFLSAPSAPGPQFRLIYQLKDGLMSGKFQVHMPGQTEWKSYLEWSGSLLASK